MKRMEKQWARYQEEGGGGEERQRTGEDIAADPREAGERGWCREVLCGCKRQIRLRRKAEASAGSAGIRGLVCPGPVGRNTEERLPLWGDHVSMGENKQ